MEYFYGLKIKKRSGLLNLSFQYQLLLHKNSPAIN